MLSTRFVPKMSSTIIRRYASNYSGSGICTPPMTPISTAEKIGWGVFMFASFFTVPVWVLVNLDSYKGKR